MPIINYSKKKSLASPLIAYGGARPSARRGALCITHTWKKTIILNNQGLSKQTKKRVNLQNLTYLPKYLP